MDGEDVICWWFACSYWHMINTGSKLCLSVDHASISPPSLHVSSFMNCVRGSGAWGKWWEVMWSEGWELVPSSRLSFPPFLLRTSIQKRERERDAKKAVNNPIFEVIRRVQQTRLNTTVDKQKSLTRLSVRRATVFQHTRRYEHANKLLVVCLDELYLTFNTPYSGIPRVLPDISTYQASNWDPTSIWVQLVKATSGRSKVSLL